MTRVTWRRFSGAHGILFLILALILAACSARKAPFDTLRTRLPGDPPSLDWTVASDYLSKEVITALHEGLLEQDRDAKIRGALAESWEISKDGKTYTFQLRPGLRWSDGQTLTSQHFVDAWERLLSPSTAASYAYFLFDVVGARDYAAGKSKDFAKVGVRALDERTLEVRLEAPTAYWIYIPSFWVTFPIRKDLIARFKDRWTEPGNLVSAGPYVLKAWEHDSRVLLERNPLYRVPGTGVPKIEYRVIKDDSTAVTLFRTGQLDIVRDLPPAQLTSLAKEPGFTSFPYYRGFYVGFGTKHPQVSDVRARRALAAAIDRNELAKALGAIAIPAINWVPEGLLGADAKRGVAFDPGLAKRLWAELPTRPRKIELWYDQSGLNKLAMENVQNQWKRVLGLDVELVSQEWKIYTRSLRGRPLAAWRMGWGADYPDPDTFLALFTCLSGNNFTGLCSATYDEAIRSGGRSLDPHTRAEAYAKAEKILLEEQVAIVPLFRQRNIRLVSPRVGNFYVNLMGDFLFREFDLRPAP